MDSAGDSVSGSMVLGLISFIPGRTIGSQYYAEKAASVGDRPRRLESDSYDQDAIILQPVRLRHRELGWAAVGIWSRTETGCLASRSQAGRVSCTPRLLQAAAPPLLVNDADACLVSAAD